MSATEVFLAALRTAAGSDVSAAQALTALQANEVVNISPPPPLFVRRPKKTIEGSQNELDKWGVFPRILGRLRYYPKLFALPVTEIEKSTSFLRLALTFGRGPLDISDLRLGDIPFDRIGSANLQYELRPGYTASNPDPATGQGDPPLTLYPDVVKEETVDAELQQGADWTSRRCRDDADAAAVDLFFPDGLGKVTLSTGKVAAYSVKVRLQYRKVGDAWPTSDNLSAFTLKMASDQAVRETVRFSFPARGNYEVRLLNASSKDNDTSKVRYLSEIRWSVLRSYKNAIPINLEGCCNLVLRVKQTELTTGALDQVSGVAHAILPYWNGSAWVTGKTEAVEAAFRCMLQTAVVSRPVADAGIDLAELQAWADNCRPKGYKFSGVFEDEGTLQDRLDVICAAGRGSFELKDGLYSVVQDFPKPATPAALITSANSGRARSTQLLVRQPHALRVLFTDPSREWQQSERIAYSPGYTAANATVFETLDLSEWVKDPDQAWSLGMFHLAQARLRNEVFERELGVEFVSFGRGSLVKVQDDVVLQGVGSGRVVSVQMSGGNCTGITLDEEVPFDGATTFAVRVRKADLTHVVKSLTVAASPSKVCVFASAITAGNPMPATGDLVAFGLAGSETADCLVRSVEPAPGLRARVSLVPYAPDVFTADGSTAPAYSTVEAAPPPANTKAAAAPEVEKAKGTPESSSVPASTGGSYVPTVKLSISPPKTKKGHKGGGGYKRPKK